MKALEHYLKELPLIAILRGLNPDSALSVAEALLEAGFAIIEVPLNSPRPYESIRILADRFGDQILVGAGTVTERSQVTQVIAAGGRLVVSPNFCQDVVEESKAQGLISIPGIATPTEAFAALSAGADALKLFPAELITPSVLKAMRAVLPAQTRLLPVGGISPQNMLDYWRVGAAGFGLGSALYKPEMTAQTIATNALAFRYAFASFS